MSNSAAKELKFLDLCIVLDNIEAAKSSTVKYDKLKELYKNYRTIGENLKRGDPSADTSFFPLLRLLLPHRDRERPPYGVSERLFWRIIMKILGKPQDATAYKDFGAVKHDFTQMTMQLLNRQFKREKILSIHDLNEHLDTIAGDISGRRENDILKLLQVTCPSEQKWIFRMMFKKLQLGIRESKILTLFHSEADILLNNSNSLLLVCNTLSDPSVTTAKTTITLFTPIRPMLSKACDAKVFDKIVKDGKNFIVETKFDGERFQLHMEDHKFKFFSRNGYDFTKKFGETYEIGLYTPLLQGVFSDHVKSVVLDGEMMGWNKESKTFGCKGMTFDVKNLSDTSHHQPCFCVYDVLFLNGEILATQPLEERKKILDGLFITRTGVIIHVDSKRVSTRESILKALNDTADSQEEGIVFKDPQSKYVPNDRNAGWWKMKLEYFEGCMSDLDVIIMGGFCGSRGQINGFLVGVAAPCPLSATPKRFLSFAKISTGLSSEEWRVLRKHLEPHCVKTVGDNYEAVGLNFGKIKPDVWVPPKKSCILQVRGSELIKQSSSNKDYKTPYTLRFARIEKVRYDKPLYDCLKLAELLDLVPDQSYVRKLYKKCLRLEDIENELKPTKEFKPKFKDNNVEVEERLSDILRDLEFHVLSGTAEFKVDEIEKLIKENGGKVVKSEGKHTFCIIAGEKHMRFETYSGSIDIVKFSWLQKVLDCREVYPYSPEDMIYTCRKTRRRFRQQYDEYGDSYTEEATRYSLEQVIANIRKKRGPFIPDLSEIDELRKEMGYEKRLSFNDDEQ